MFELAKNIVSKRLIVSKIFLKKVFELFFCYPIFGFRATFLLMPLLNYCFVEKQGKKRDLIWLVGSNDFKIVFTLLAKTIAI